MMLNTLHKLLTHTDAPFVAAAVVAFALELAVVTWLWSAGELMPKFIERNERGAVIGAWSQRQYPTQAQVPPVSASTRRSTTETVAPSDVARPPSIPEVP
jgi:hypothetical protein